MTLKGCSPSGGQRRRSFDTATMGAARSDLPSVVAALVGGGALVNGLPLLTQAFRFMRWLALLRASRK